MSSWYSKLPLIKGDQQLNLIFLTRDRIYTRPKKSAVYPPLLVYIFVYYSQVFSFHQADINYYFSQINY